MKHFLRWLIVHTLIGVDTLNSAQRKHAATTFRAMGIALIGALGWTLSTASSVVIALSLGSIILVLAISCEIIALRILSTQEDSDDD